MKYKKKQNRTSSISIRTFLLWIEEVEDIDIGGEYPYDEEFEDYSSSTGIQS